MMYMGVWLCLWTVPSLTTEVEDSGPAQCLADVAGERQSHKGSKVGPGSRQSHEARALQRRSPPSPHRHHGRERHTLRKHGGRQRVRRMTNTELCVSWSFPSIFLPPRSPPTLAVQTASKTRTEQPEGWGGWGQPCPARPNPGRWCPRSDRPGNLPGSVCTGSRRRRRPAASPESQSPTGTEGSGMRGQRERECLW